MKEVDEFKKQNSNVTYSVKELLGALNIKMDRVEQRLIDGDKMFSTLRTTDKWHTRLIWAIYVGLGGIVYLILELTGVL